LNPRNKKAPAQAHGAKNVNKHVRNFTHLRGMPHLLRSFVSRVQTSMIFIVGICPRPKPAVFG
jgi:hypothetical protein